MVACSDCFRNDGFRRVLAEQGIACSSACPRCSSVNGRKLGVDALAAAAQEFFVRGSVAPETLAPVFQLNRLNDSPALLDPTLSQDASLLRSLSGLVVFNYGPPMWQLGYTDHYHDFQDGDAAEVADALVRTGATARVPSGAELYRIRRNLDVVLDVLHPRTFDPPPAGVAREPGRWDDLSSPVLYVSDDVELCLHECRVALPDEIVLATLVLTRDLSLLDVSQGFGTTGSTPFEDGGLFADFMSRSRRDDWLVICRAVAAAARRAGYDGLRYTSYYASAMGAEAGLNLALFGRPLAEGLLRLRSLNRLRLKSVRYEYGFGPALFEDSTSNTV